MLLNLVSKNKGLAVIYTSNFLLVFSVDSKIKLINSLRLL
jgi:hypothetical protein